MKSVLGDFMVGKCGWCGKDDGMTRQYYVPEKDRVDSKETVYLHSWNDCFFDYMATSGLKI